ncbi:MAG: hypothetical protein JJT96_19330 [Opitutales bacterium]|nr:hypothetical protein [Opitutales bacterium]
MARKFVYRPGEAGVFHCINRCVRRAFLCGWDGYSGRSFEHRREWVRERVKELCGIFALEVCAYAVMANYVHLVVRTRPEVASAWSDEEVARRWLRLCPGRRDQVGASVESDRVAMLAKDAEKVKVYRERLGNLSWFMRGLSEVIARRANEEDRCKGRFWEGRFKCQRLADAGAVAACMAYVDLNPVRAGEGGVLGMSEERYLQLVDWTGRRLHDDKAGAIPADLAPVLDRLELDVENWVSTVERYGSLYHRVAGRMEKLAEAARALGQRWVKRRDREACAGVYRAA